MGPTTKEEIEETCFIKSCPRCSSLSLVCLNLTHEDEWFVDWAGACIQCGVEYTLQLKKEQPDDSTSEQDNDQSMS